MPDLIPHDALLQWLNDPWWWVETEDCPECGDVLISPGRQGWHYDGDPAVCCDCRRVWWWTVDDGEAYILDRRDHDEDAFQVDTDMLDWLLTRKTDHA